MLYEWLNDYQRIEEEIDFLEFQLDRYEKELKRWVEGDLTNVKLNEKSLASNIENNIFSVQYELAHKMNDLYEMKKLIGTFKGLENKILYGKYVEGKTLETIAEELSYSTQYIYNKHALIKRMVRYKNGIS